MKNDSATTPDDGQEEKKPKKLDSKKENTQKQNTAESPDVEEFIKEMPAKFRQTMQMAIMSSTRQNINPMLEKFNENHIDKFLDYSHKDEQNEYKLKNTNRFFYLSYVLIALGFLVFLITYLLPIDKALLTDILKLLVIFGGGFGSGYGLKAYRSKG